MMGFGAKFGLARYWAIKTHEPYKLVLKDKEVMEMASSSATFWDRIAKRYSRQPIADEAAYQTKLRITQTHLQPETELLEFGCGTGSTAIIHAPYVKHIRAIDISSKMIEIAQAKAAAAHIENITFEQSSIEALKLAEHSLDVVLGLSILHLVEDKEAVIAQIYKMLKPGGVFISSTSCLGESLSWLKFITPIGRLIGLMPMLMFFTHDELQKCLTDSGFVIDYSWQPSEGKAVFIVAKKPC